MRRLLFVATGAFFVVAALLPTQRAFVADAAIDGERLAMYSKPAVVRIVDGAAGQILLQLPGYQPRTFNVSAIGLGSGFFISSNGYIATNAHVVSTTKEGEEKASKRCSGRWSSRSRQAARQRSENALASQIFSNSINTASCRVFKNSIT